MAQNCFTIVYKLLSKMIKNKTFKKFSLENIKGIFIDIDNTLYSYDDAHKIAIKGCYDFLKHKDLIKKIPFKRFNEIYRFNRALITRRLHPHGSCRSRLLAFQLVFEEFPPLKSLKPAALASTSEDLYWKILIANMKPNTELIKFIINAQKSGIKTCVVTDMQTNIQIKKLKKLKILQHIDYVVTSEEVGKEKPSKEIFLAALKKCNLAKKDVVMIGDNLHKDIQGAQKIGIKAVQVYV